MELVRLGARPNHCCWELGLVKPHRVPWAFERSRRADIGIAGSAAGSVSAAAAAAAAAASAPNAASNAAVGTHAAAVAAHAATSVTTTAAAAAAAAATAALESSIYISQPDEAHHQLIEASSSSTLTTSTTTSSSSSTTSTTTTTSPTTIKPPPPGTWPKPPTPAAAYAPMCRPQLDLAETQGEDPEVELCESHRSTSILIVSSSSSASVFASTRVGSASSSASSSSSSSSSSLPNSRMGAGTLLQHPLPAPLAFYHEATWDAEQGKRAFDLEWFPPAARAATCAIDLFRALPSLRRLLGSCHSCIDAYYRVAGGKEPLHPAVPLAHLSGKVLVRKVVAIYHALSRLRRPPNGNSQAVVWLDFDVVIIPDALQLPLPPSSSPRPAPSQPSYYGSASFEAASRFILAHDVSYLPFRFGNAAMTGKAGDNRMRPLHDLSNDSSWIVDTGMPAPSHHTVPLFFG